MRPAAAEDDPALADLYEVVFGYRRPDEHDRWKYVDNPAGPRIAVVAESGRQVVGQYALWPTVLDLGGRPVQGAQSLDTMVHPDFRGQGMFTKLANACFELAAERGVRALYGFPNAASYPGFIRRLNWDHTGDIPRMVRVLRPSQLGRLPGGIGGIADAAVKLLPRGRSGDHEVLAGLPGPAELSNLLGDGEKDTCRIARSPEWLRWRYADASQRRYQWLTVKRGDATVGCAVWGIRDDGQGVLGECLGIDQGAVNAAVAGAVDGAARAGLAALHAITNLPAVLTGLRWAGFAPRNGAPLIVRSMTHETLPANIHDHGAWRIAGGDLDTF